MSNLLDHITVKRSGWSRGHHLVFAEERERVCEWLRWEHTDGGIINCYTDPAHIIALRLINRVPEQKVFALSADGMEYALDWAEDKPDRLTCPAGGQLRNT